MPSILVILKLAISLSEGSCRQHQSRHRLQAGGEGGTNLRLRFRPWPPLGVVPDLGDAVDNYPLDTCTVVNNKKALGGGEGMHPYNDVIRPLGAL